MQLGGAQRAGVKNQLAAFAGALGGVQLGGVKPVAGAKTEPSVAPPAEMEGSFAGVQAGDGMVSLELLELVGTGRTPALVEIVEAETS